MNISLTISKITKIPRIVFDTIFQKAANHLKHINKRLDFSSGNVFQKFAKSA